MTRSDVSAAVLSQKQKLGLSWAAITEALQGAAGSATPATIVFYTAALLGSQQLSRTEAEKAVSLLELEDGAAALLAMPPSERGADTMMPPTDPLIYRFYELVQNYGQTWKELINEQFGDGIMSAIDFNMTIGREAHPAGDRVRIEMSGKFLPYRRF